MDLETISKEFKIDLKELQAVEKSLRQKYSSVANIMPPEQIEKYISCGVQQHVDKFKNLGLEQWFGVILTLSSPQDGVAKKRSEAIKKYVEDPTLAVAGGIVQEYKDGMLRKLTKGVVETKAVSPEQIPKIAMYLPDQKAYIVPLDSRESWPSGKKNFGYLKPLPLEQYFTNIEGIASKDGTQWEPFKMVFNCNEHINTPEVNVPQSKIVKFFAKTKSKAPLVLNYNNKYTKFEPVEGDIKQLDTNIMTFYDVTPLSDIEAKYAGRKTPYDVVATFGTVLNKWQKEPTDDKPYPWISVVMTDNTREQPLKVLIHPDMSAAFEEQSIVKVWGSLSEGKKWDPDTREATEEKEITLFATGVYTFSVSETIPEEKPDDGWEA